MEDSTETGAMETSTMYSQVVFNDIPHSYPPNVPVTCVYTLTAALQPHTRDWVGIFKVGWSTTKDYHTFVWVEPSLDVVGQEPVRKQVFFREYYLPKDDAEFYQFCYVDSNGQVRGASTPFCYRAAGEQSMDCSLENDLLVITTQEQVEQSEREKDELVTELGQLKEQNDTLRSVLKEQQQEVDQLKVSNAELAQAVSKLEEEKKQQARDQEELTQKVKEQELTLKAREHEELTQSAITLDGQKPLTPSHEKYDRAVIKINQLKQEREELSGKVDVFSVEIAQLRPRVGECLRLNDRIQLLQIDLQSSEKEKERLSAELQKLRGVVNEDLEELRTENRDLRRSLSEQEPLQEVADGDWKMQYQTVLDQLQDARSKLHQEIHASNSAQRRAEQAERELEATKELLETKAITCSEMTQKLSELEMRMTATYREIEEKENLMRIGQEEEEELARDNQDFTRDIEKLHQEFSDFQAVSPAAPPAQPAAPSVSLQHSNPYSLENVPFIDPTATGVTQQQGSWSESLHYGNPYENTDISAEVEELCLECQYCQERFPGITTDELEAHEQSHRVCPFCVLICDTMEQAVFEDHVYSHEV